MTTDITELAQRVKTEASAIDDTQWYLAKPSEIRSLVEALEKAQQYAKERDAENQDLMLTVGRLRVEREELESRTVKLPNSNDERFWGYGSEFEVKLYDSCVFYALTAAGIKWEAE
ncbi:ead/Ea22-like family protein [Raoultella ornithinolytica]|uniref:ead/Ea22-like family protein n=1 Tax=Raoultella ornithinolytica TaxID=54291 RepID=UPI0039B5B761